MFLFSSNCFKFYYYFNTSLFVKGSLKALQLPAKLRLYYYYSIFLFNNNNKSSIHIVLEDFVQRIDCVFLQCPNIFDFKITEFPGHTAIPYSVWAQLWAVVRGFVINAWMTFTCCIVHCGCVLYMSCSVYHTCHYSVQCTLLWHAVHVYEIQYDLPAR